MVGDDFWEEPEDRERVVREQFARAGIDQDRQKPPRPPDPTAPARLAWLAKREGFFTPPGSVTISPALAELLHFKGASSG